MKIVVINGEQHEFSRLKLRQWIELSFVRNQITAAVEAKTVDALSDAICKFVSTAVGVSEEITKNATWQDIALALASCTEENDIDRTIPLFKYNEKQDEEVWEYPGRAWYVWWHKFSKEFGWSVDVIAELDVDDAFKLLQEMLLSEQLEREWQWSLSEKSSGYDENAKKGKYIELPRPSWMDKPKKEQPKVIQIPRSLLPVGNVIRYEPPKRTTTV